ncbi:MAG: 2-oxo acid dehydrogenase subunit E2 [Bacteroidia bacterium]|nr:2-oxo acid dehydrogenase subunit E2 [Bacteroidia bacterium]
MARFELTMPKMGESIIEATVLRWLKNIGEDIEAEETVLEIATDKVDSEVPSPVEGKLVERRFEEGAVVPVGAVIGIIETERAAVDSHDNGSPAEAVEAVSQEVPYVPNPVAAGAAHSEEDGDMRFYSPLVLNIARKEGISMTQLEAMSGTGRGGRVTKKDILDFVENKSVPAPPAPAVKPAEAPKPEAKPADTQVAPRVPKEITFTHSGNYEIQEMDRMRKLIAQNMVNSKHVSAHVTSFVEADVTSIVMWRNKVKNQFQEEYGEKLTFTPIFIQAIAKALREHPLVNSSIDGDKILIKKDINIGVAVALPNDNLIVPVIRHADRLNLAGITAALNDIADRARRNQLRPAELEGGTYTVSNVGTFGNVMGTPIILQPQVAILATGAIRKIPAVLETPQGDVIAIRQRMFLSHSYDHRIIDGALGGRFVKRVADILENWDMNTKV